MPTCHPIRADNTSYSIAVTFLSEDPNYLTSQSSALVVGGTAPPLSDTKAFAPALEFPFLNVDDDSIGMVIYANPNVCSEPYYGYIAYIYVNLLSEPKDTVLLVVTSSLPSEAAPMVNLVAITAEDWTEPKQVAIESIDDPMMDGDRPINITIATLFSQDPDYGRSGPNKDGATGLFSQVVGILSMDDPDDTSATACAAGFYGEYADVGQSSPAYHDSYGCYYCPAGTWVDETNDKTACRSCPPGTYGLIKGAQSWQSTTSWDDSKLDPGCLPCPNGTYSAAWGATTCNICPGNASCPTIATITPQPTWMVDPPSDHPEWATIGEVGSVYHHWSLLKPLTLASKISFLPYNLFGVRGV
jgi:hypothetical protein